MARMNGVADWTGEDGTDQVDDLVSLSDLSPTMIPALRVGGETLMGYNWDRRRPLSLEVRVGALIASIRRVPYAGVGADGEAIQMYRFDEADYAEKVGRVLCELIPGLTEAQADLLTEAERGKILRRLNYAKDAETKEPDGDAERPLEPSTGAKRRRGSQPSTRAAT